MRSRSANVACCAPSIPRSWARSANPLRGRALHRERFLRDAGTANANETTLKLRGEEPSRFFSGSHKCTMHLQVIVKIMAEYEQMLQKKHALLNRVEGATSEVERQHLRRASSQRHIAATLLPIRSVGVQVYEGYPRLD